jgi:hypothetical protein
VAGICHGNTSLELLQICRIKYPINNRRDRDERN